MKLRLKLFNVYYAKEKHQRDTQKNCMMIFGFAHGVVVV